MSDIRTIAWAAAVAVAVISSPAGAADLRRPPPPAYVPPIIWTGFHVGAHAGYAFLGEDATSAFFGTPVTFSTNPGGVLGGLEAGYDYQFSPNWLVGAELDLSWTTASGNFNFIPRRRPAPLPAASSTAITIGTTPSPAASDI
jgi:outer membrane immunogenic protein